MWAGNEQSVFHYKALKSAEKTPRICSKCAFYSQTLELSLKSGCAPPTARTKPRAPVFIQNMVQKRWSVCGGAGARSTAPESARKLVFHTQKRVFGALAQYAQLIQLAFEKDLTHTKMC